MTIHSPKTTRRHETCFKSSEDKSNVKFLRDRITCKLKPHGANTKGIKITKTVTAPKDTVTSTVCSYKDGKISCKTGVDHHYSRSTASHSRRCCKYCSLSVPPKTEIHKPENVKRGSSLERTFGIEKRKVDLTLPKITHENRFKLMKDLTSPTEVKKAQMQHSFADKTYPPGTIIKKSSALFSSVKNTKTAQKLDEKSLNVQVAISPKGREILQPSSITRKSSRSPSASPVLSRSRISRVSPVPSNVSSKSSIKSRSTSVDSLQSPVAKRKVLKPSVSSILDKRATKEDSDRDKKKSKKLKKDLNNEEIKKDKKSKTKEKGKDDKKLKKCAGRTAGSQIVKKLKTMEKIEKDITPVATKEDIAKTKDIVQSESFFQHLFLRDITSPTPSVASKSSWISEKSRIFEGDFSKPFNKEPTLAAIKVYLSHRKPVSESKFKTLDREIMRSRSVSPSIRNFVQFDSISEVSNEDIAERDLKLKRSSSLPASRIMFTEPRSLSPEKLSGRQMSPIRSPSLRRIQGRALSSASSEGTKRVAVRARSAGEADAMKKEYDGNSLYQSTASLSQISDTSDYKSYITDMRHMSRKSDRFKELNHFYSSLERLGHLERTFSSTDLRPRRKNEDEIIDYDRWRQVRTRERAESEFNSLYRKLKLEQKEKDLLFRTRDVENYKWNRSRESGLRVKEKSVENIKELFESFKEKDYNKDMADCKSALHTKDTYKPLWRGDSVLNLATKMVEKRSQSESRVLSAKQRLLYSERQLTKEIGSRLWSSLSMEQINAIRNQLADIYSKAPPKRQPIDHSIEVSPVIKRERLNNLVVRRNSDIDLKGKVVKPIRQEKSSSISKLPTEPQLSEIDKKRLSQTLSQEVRDKIAKKYKTTMSVILKKVENKKDKKEAIEKPCYKTKVTRTPHVCEVSRDKCKRHNHQSLDENANDRNLKSQESLSETEMSKALVKRVPSLSETESASSDTSVSTAIFLGKKDNIEHKIEYFETGAGIESYVPTVYKPADDNNFETPPDSPKDKKLSQITSQSYTDLKELFGEKELMKFATIPLSASRKVFPKDPKLLTELTSPVIKRKCRSLSPDTEKYWLAYLAYIKRGDVRNLAKKFEHLKDFYSNRATVPYRHCASDPELARSDKYNQFGDVFWLASQYENLGRGRSKIRRSGALSPIPKHVLKAEDRYMPHINIISKLASLYPKKSLDNKPLTVEDWAKSLGCPVGEVEKLRDKFDSPTREMSLLGHMFTSSPNLHELRDVAPYLAGPWVAHRFPKKEDNARSLSAPDETGRTIMKRSSRRPKSASPLRSSVNLASILKSDSLDRFANQSYDPSIHQPVYRYEPNARERSWSPKHSVKFKG